MQERDRLSTAHRVIPASAARQQFASIPASLPWLWRPDAAGSTPSRRVDSELHTRDRRPLKSGRSGSVWCALHAGGSKPLSCAHTWTHSILLHSLAQVHLHSLARGDHDTWTSSVWCAVHAAWLDSSLSARACLLGCPPCPSKTRNRHARWLLSQHAECGAVQSSTARGPRPAAAASVNSAELRAQSNAPTPWACDTSGPYLLVFVREIGAWASHSGLRFLVLLRTLWYGIHIGLIIDSDSFFLQLFFFSSWTVWITPFHTATLQIAVQRWLCQCSPPGTPPFHVLSFQQISHFKQQYIDDYVSNVSHVLSIQYAPHDLSHISSSSARLALLEVAHDGSMMPCCWAVTCCFNLSQPSFNLSAANQADPGFRPVLVQQPQGAWHLEFECGSSINIYIFFQIKIFK